MNWIKNLFLVCVLNFFMVIGVVLYRPYTAPVSPALETNEVSAPVTTAKKTNEKQEISKQTDPLEGKCLVYIDGTRYNMSEFKNIHGGGDIFQCGTDMTEIFYGEHPKTYLDKISRYKI